MIVKKKKVVAPYDTAGRWNQIGLFLTLLALAVLNSSCTIRGSHGKVYLSEERFAAKPATTQIQLIPGEPDQAYYAIGEVHSFADVKMPGGPDPQTAIERIKKLAREMGGDAIIRYRASTAPAGTVGAGGFTAQGMVIRWRK